jgi:hypothetical protein
MGDSITKIKNLEFPEGKENAIYKYLDLLIVHFPDFESFRISDFSSNITNETSERDKIIYVSSEIKKVMLELDLAKYSHQSTIMIELTEKGRIAKSKGGYFKYLNSFKPKTDWLKIIPIILTFLFGTTATIFAFLNYNINADKNNLTIEKDSLKLQNDSLIVVNEQLKIQIKEHENLKSNK